MSDTKKVKTTEEKLKALYEIRDHIHPLVMVLVVGFTETQKGKLLEHDVQFVEEIYPHYFKEDGTRK